MKKALSYFLVCALLLTQLPLALALEIGDSTPTNTSLYIDKVDITSTAASNVEGVEPDRAVLPTLTVTTTSTNDQYARITALIMTKEMSESTDIDGSGTDISNGAFNALAGLISSFLAKGTDLADSSTGLSSVIVGFTLGEEYGFITSEEEWNSSGGTREMTSAGTVTKQGLKLMGAEQEYVCILASSDDTTDDTNWYTFNFKLDAAGNLMVPESTATITGLQINSATAADYYKTTDLTVTATGTAVTGTLQGGKYSLKAENGDNTGKYWDVATNGWVVSEVWNDTTMSSATLTATLSASTGLVDGGEYTVTMYAVDTAGAGKPTTTNGNETVSATFKVDTTAPTVTSIVRTADAAEVTKDTPVSFTVTYDEAVKGVSAADFAITNGSFVSATGTSGQVNATAYYTGWVVTVTPSGEGEVKLATATSSWTAEDQAGNTVAANQDKNATYTYDTTAPVLNTIAIGAKSIATGTSSVTDIPQSGTVTIALTETNKLTSGTIADKSGFTLASSDGGTAGTIGDITYTATGLTIAYSGLSNDKTYTLVIPASKVADAAGNTMAAYTSCAFKTVDILVSTATVTAGGADLSGGNYQIYKSGSTNYTYGDAASAATFTITSTGNAAINGMKVSLTGADADKFELASTTDNLVNGTGTNLTATGGGTDSVTFTVKPKTGADVKDGGYTATLNITGDGQGEAGHQFTSTTVTVKFGLEKKQLTWTNAGLTAGNKVYDRNTDATLSGKPTLGDIITGQAQGADAVDVALAANAKGAFADTNAADNKNVTVTAAQFELTGAKKDNYIKPAGNLTVTANITKKPVGITVSKVIGAGGTLAAGDITLTAADIISPDAVSVASVTGTIANTQVGTGAAVQITALGLGGAQAGNYMVLGDNGSAAIGGGNNLSTTGAITAAPLDGTAQFNAGGTAPVLGTEITVELNGTTANFANGQYSIHWYRSDNSNLTQGDLDAATEITSASNSTTYTPVTADAGKYLLVEFRGDGVNYSGFKAVATGAAVVKKTQAAVVTDVTIDDAKNQITFTKNADGSLTYEYTIDNGGTWLPVLAKTEANAPVVIGITGTQATASNVQIRVAENDEFKVGSGVAAGSGSFTIPTQVTGAPANLILTAGSESIKAEWDDYTTETVKSYNVYVYDDDTAIKVVNVPAPGTLTGKVSVNLTGLTASKEYGVRVSAIVEDTLVDYEGDQCAAVTATPTAPSYSGGGGVSSYTVTYNVGEHGKLAEGAKKTESVNYKKSPSKVPEVVANEGYKFLGWSLDGKTVVDPTAEIITKSITFTALYDGTGLAFSKDLTTPYIKGIEENGNLVFKPESPMTRGEVAVMLTRTLNLKMDEAKDYAAGKFADLNGDEWYAQAVGYLAELGVMKGSEGLCNGNQNITRAEFVTLVMRIDGIVTGENKFPDVSADNWATEPIIAAAAKGYISGNEVGNFMPGENITRASVVKIMNGILGWSEQATGEMLFTDVAYDHWAYNDIIKASTGK